MRKKNYEYKDFRQGSFNVLHFQEREKKVTSIDPEMLALDKYYIFEIIKEKDFYGNQFFKFELPKTVNPVRIVKGETLFLVPKRVEDKNNFYNSGLGMNGITQYRKNQFVLVANYCEFYDGDDWVLSKDDKISSENTTITWSPLLEAAFNFQYNSKELTQCISEVKIEDISEAFLTLNKALKIIDKYRNGKWGHKYGWIYEFRSCVLPESIKNAYIALLLNLTKECYEKLDFSEADKRLLEEGLIDRVRECKDIPQVIELYNKYDQLSVLEHQRNPSIDKIKASLLGKKYSSLKKNFLEAVQKQIIELMQDGCSQELIEALKKKIFNTINLKFGVNKSWQESFEKEITKPKKQIELSVFTSSS